MNFDGMNDGQKAAVLHMYGPCVVIAGAGSGKTRVLTHRIAHLIEEGIPARNILACTFTKKAANEMAERLGSLVGPAVEDLNVSTIHSMCYRILREEWRNQGRYYDVLADHEQKRILKQLLAPPGPKNSDGMNWDLDIGQALRSIGNFKNDLIAVDQAYQMSGDDGFKRRLARLYQLYEQKKRVIAKVDFDDMLILCYQMLSENPAILSKWQSRFTFILVDEFQDTNHAQWEIIRMLAEPERNLFVVGDDWQSIYAFRGAKPEYIINFESYYSGAQVIFLDVNYRCTENIIRLSNAVIGNNRNQVKKTLRAHNPPGQEPATMEAVDQDHEASLVLGEIEALRKEHGYNWSDFAILFRTNAQSRAFEDLFIRQNIPHIILGSQGFYARREIRDIVAYLEVALDPHSDDAVKRVINVPSRYLGKVFVQTVEQWAARHGISFFDALTSCPDILNYQARNVVQFLDAIHQIARVQDPAEAVMAVRDIAGYDDYLRKEEGGADDADNFRLENLNELVSAALKFRTVGEFVRFAKEAGEAKPSDEGVGDRIQLMSFHRSKGLEFPVVFMVGVNQGLLPHKNACVFVNGELVPESVEEERRLCYVGMTRSKKRLYMSHVQAYQGKDMVPSMFLGELHGRLLAEVC